VSGSVDKPSRLNTKECFLCTAKFKPWGFVEVIGYRPLGQNNYCPLVQCTIEPHGNRLQGESAIWEKNIAIFAIPFVINMKILAISDRDRHASPCQRSLSSDLFIATYDINLIATLGS
jgi:hypothetical protein